MRIQRNIGKESTVGVFLSDYNFGASHNRVGSLDARWKIAKNWVAVGQAIASATRYLDGTRSAGPAYLAFLNRNGLHFNYFGNYVDRNPGFHTDLGFVPRTDIRMTTQNANYNWRPKATPVASFGFSSFSNADWNRQNRFQDSYTGATFFLNFRRATGFNINHIWSYELYQGIGFHKHGTEMYFYSDRFKRVGINAFFGTGTGVNYSPAAGVLRGSRRQSIRKHHHHAAAERPAADPADVFLYTSGARVHESHFSQHRELPVQPGLFAARHRRLQRSALQSRCGRL